MSTNSTSLIRLATDKALTEPGWDGYKAAPVDPAAVRAAQQFLDAISAVPTTKGGVQLEVHTSAVDFEIEFGPDGQMVSALMTANGPEHR